MSREHRSQDQVIATGPLASVRERPGVGQRVGQALRYLRQIETLLGGGGDLAEICGLVARGLGELTLADAVTVSGLPASGPHGVPIASYCAPARSITPGQIAIELAAERVRALTPGASLLIETAAAADILAPHERDYLVNLGIQQVLILPLIRHGSWLGRVDAVFLQPGALSEIELNLGQQVASQAATAMALAQAAATEAEAGNAELMLAVSEALRQAQPGSPSELLQVVVGLLPRILRCDRGVAYLWDGERQEFLPSAVNGMREDQVAILKQFAMSPQEVPLFEQVLYASRPVVIDDARASTMLPASLVDQVAMRAVLAIPLRSRRHQILGALLLDYCAEGVEFAPAQVTLAARIADQVAAVIENASLYEEVSRRSDRLAVLSEIGLDLASLTELPEIFPAIYDKLATVIDASALFCALQEPESQRLVIYHLVGAQLDVCHDFDLASSALLTQVFHEGQAVLLTAAADVLVPNLGTNPSGTSRAQSLVCVPMRVRGQQVIGALAAYSAFAHAYSREDQELLSTVASQIAVAVENAHLYAQVQAKGELRGQLLDRIMSAHELERKSIVDDIHDDSLQAMVSSMYKIDLCLRLSETQNHQRELEELRTLRNNLSANVDRLRSLIFEIRPSTLDYLGLLPTLDDYLTRLEQATGIRPTFRSELGARLESGMETLIYRLVQELLSNVRKHSKARAVTIELKRFPQGVYILVQDDGIGFVPETVLGRLAPHTGIGLAAVREQVQVAGGTFELGSQPGAGTRIVILLPMTAGRHITGPLDESRVARDMESL